MNQDEQLQLRARAIAAGLVLGALVGIGVGWVTGNYTGAIGTCMTVGAVAASIAARLKMRRSDKE